LALSAVKMIAAIKRKIVRTFSINDKLNNHKGSVLLKILYGYEIK
jgi:hypothetical protein